MKKESNPHLDCGKECCKVVAIVSVDAKGQLVLPKELREMAGIEPGEKLAVSTWARGGKVVCLSLTKVEMLAEKIRETLEPLMKAPFGA